MKNKTALLLLMLIALSLLGADLIYVVNSQSRTLSRIDTSSDQVQNTFSILGNVPNKVVVGEDYLYAVNSGDNTIQKIDKSGGNSLANYLVELGSNPWDAVLHEGYLYITGLFTARVYKMDASNGEVIASLQVGTAPEALCVVGDKLYTTNAGDYAQNYAGSSVSVIDLPSFSVFDTLPVRLNPQYLRWHEGYLHVSCTGNWADIGGSIMIFDTQNDSLIQTIELGGTPGNIWIDADHLAWVADSSGNHIYRYHALSYEILNGSDNPLPIGGSDLTGSSSAIVILTPQWGSNASVLLLHPDLSLIKEYTVGMMPTDLKLEPSPSPVEDDLITQARICVYPNPLPMGTSLKIKSERSLKADLKIFNLKGQLLQETHLEGTELNLDTTKLSSGCYFYRIITSQGTESGKFVILK
ncbi:MAG: T9SS type A sorting domain-containing protein [Candidatus Cloacimonadaceae bacterium]|jgi:DNA-binding beta-propeller fold protein YncE|nr:T9SS type A sorting domain-containing protein [Candidatus Cloacimonadota bacterium]MCK9178054.1 T9SS type A sorting domain-containing protein [Candidatus Cloacimonadota bacterium]MDD3103687.1 T9SS type A sorting domain-containing protein [Candidatus Cloacimonadota bacterium]MDD3532880.1 T9SS type A sorting domain-containing protein [Candidatus Cloacimonadota bacterium]MDY0127624.1 T9SS type A sorting domain-containing protein [Candidatus Cloacimonadaceae bacterium]